ncbi:YdaU family protein [Pelagibacterium luteolum]|uniref:Uncharacterized conserved protein YdaU, DUF1376 family n=1 Tax=Pelagibacterium luteolum TaxID=440168 RepID=A0A1G7ZHI0_9HYPH|nr:Uncharacterized conserved protein YdaU, DUF1376 family [Pelagibacterium luteolum]
MTADYAPNFSQHVLPYVKWFQDDFINGVRGMKAHEIGIYTTLLMEMYARGKPLDLSHDRLARLCGADRRTFTRALAMLIEEGKIVRLDSGLWNERCENAFRERAKMQEQQSAAGRTSAEKRNKINAPSQRPLNARSTPVQPILEAQTIREDTPNGDVPVVGKAGPVGGSPGLEKQAYDFGKTVLGKSAGGVITKLKKHHRGDWAEVLATLRMAADKADPSEWVGAVLAGKRDLSWEKREADIYASVQ